MAESAMPMLGAPAGAQVDPPAIQRAAGVMFVAPDGRLLLMRRAGRDHPGCWALPGGGIEEGESAEEAARRETLEETGFEYEGRLIPWTRRLLNCVDFTTFLGEADAFEPTLNEEHDRFMWVDRGFAQAAVSVLHPGLGIALSRFDLDELGIAKAIRAGELASPQRYGSNLMLVALRITGTGAAYRQGLDEFVWRDPALYLNPEFLERCQGLPVILEHPEKSTLNTEEFRKRIVGTIMLSYIQGDEVWGIARILDMDAAQMIEEERLSTSPAVVVRSADPGSRTTFGSSKLLIEGKPVLLDHVAICPQGVWDKGGKPTGLDSIDAQVDDLPEVKLDAALEILRDAAVTTACRRLNV